MGRIIWFLNSKRQPESKKETKQKIISIMESKNKNCLVIGYGFYFNQMKRFLKRNNYSGSNTRYYKDGKNFFAPNPGNGLKCNDPDWFRVTTIPDGVIISVKSIGGMFERFRNIGMIPGSLVNNFY